MNRRMFVSSLGMSVASIGGCLRLQEAEDQTTENENQTTDSENLSLTENWSIEPSFDHIWTSDTRFHFNGWGGWAGVANHGGGTLRWKKDISISDTDSIFSGDAFASNRGKSIFGFYPDISDDANVNAYFLAFDGRNEGNHLWEYNFTEKGENYPIGATIVDDIAVLAAYHDTDSDVPLVAGVELATGDELWQLDASESGGVSFLGQYNDDVYIAQFGSGVQVLSPGNGSVIEVKESWGVGEIDEKSGGEIHGSTLFAISGDTNSVNAYPLDSSGNNWERELIDDPREDSIAATLYVDSTLVIVGTKSGQLYALERDSGATRWSASLNEEVESTTASDSSVWASNTQGALFAFDRSSGEELHRSVQPTDGSEIAIVDDVIAFGDGEGYWIS